MDILDAFYCRRFYKEFIYIVQNWDNETHADSFYLSFIVIHYY